MDSPSTSRGGARLPPGSCALSAAVPSLFTSHAQLNFGQAHLNLARANLARGSTCWGATLAGSRWRCGDRGEHEKWCDECRANGIYIPSGRVRAVDRGSQLVNSKRPGVWAAEGATKYRLVNNNAARCTPPFLVIFEKVPSDDSHFIVIPPEWIQGKVVHFILRMNTLVPAVVQCAC
jgi:hypothetical protein